MKTKKNKKYKKTKKANRYKKTHKRGGYLEIDDRLRLQENAPIPLLKIHYFKLDNSAPAGIKAVFTVDLKNVVLSLDDINGLNLEGIIEKITSHYGFPLESLNPNLIIGKNFNVFDIEFLRDNHLGFEYDQEKPEDKTKILEQYKLLLKNKYPNIRWIPNSDQGALYFDCPQEYLDDSSNYYKIHISVNPKDLEITIKNLMSILCKYKRLFNTGKMPLPKFASFYDVRDEYARKYLEWNCGSGAANIVLYPTKECDSNPKLFEKLLHEFIMDWIEMGADEYGRELNNLYFNQRMTNSLYIGYGVDSSSKCEELEELLKNNKIPRRFKMSSNLKREQDKLCVPNYKNLASYDMLNRCLLDIYNISYLDLCDKNNYGAKDAWVLKNMPQANEILTGTECYHRI